MAQDEARSVIITFKPKDQRPDKSKDKIDVVQSVISSSVRFFSGDDMSRGVAVPSGLPEDEIGYDVNDYDAPLVMARLTDSEIEDLSNNDNVEAVEDDGQEWELLIKRRGRHTSVFYDFCPLDVVGWKGTLTVMKLNIRDIRPLMSEGVHLPPSAHCNFQAPGFVVCTFLPRPLEGDPEAERLPWYHRNIDAAQAWLKSTIR